LIQIIYLIFLQNRFYDLVCSNVKAIVGTVQSNNINQNYSKLWLLGPSAT